MKYKILFIVIFVLAFFIRTYNLNIIPVNHDEAVWLRPFADNFNKFIPIIPLRGYSHLFFGYLVFFSNKIFSSPVYIFKIPAVFIGIVTVILVYRLAKDMYGERTGLVTALLLSLLPWHVIQSRIGIEPILTPFFGCIIILILLKSIYKKNNLVFVSSWLILGIGAFYTYRASLSLIPIYIITLLILKKELNWTAPKIIFAGILFFMIPLCPLIYLQISGKADILGRLYHSYQKNPLQDRILLNLFLNLKNNTPAAFENLFFNSRIEVLYGAALRAPLLVTRLSLPIVISSLIISFYRRKNADKIILVWLGISLLFGTIGIDYYQPRYIIGAMLPFSILMGKMIAEIFTYAEKSTRLKTKILYSTGLFFLIGFVSAEIFQLRDYFQNAPYNFRECRMNSYGCEEAALFLAQIPDLCDSQIITDDRMTLYLYLKGYNISFPDEIHKKYIVKPGEKRAIYYVIWAPESHPENYWGGFFRKLYGSFRQRHPKEKPIKTICYPNGLPAIYIFKVLNNEDQNLL